MKCHYCQETLKDGATKCSHCGSELYNGGCSRIVAIIGAILMIAALVFFFSTCLDGLK